MSEQISLELQKALQCIHLNKIDDTLNIINNMREEKIIDLDNRFLFYLIKIKISKKKGNYLDSIREILKLIEEHPFLKRIDYLIDFYIELADSYRNSANFEKCEYYVKKGLKLIYDSDQENEKNYLMKKAELIKIRGLYNFDRGDTDNALRDFFICKDLNKTLNNKLFLSKINNNIAMVYGQTGNLDEALVIFIENLEIKREIGNKSLIGNTLNNLGITYRLKGELNLALSYHHQCLKIQEELGNKLSIAMSLGNIGLTYDIKGELDQALDYLQRTLYYNKEVGNKKEIGITYHNIGNTLRKKGELIEAKKSFKLSYEIAEEIGNKIILSGIIFSSTINNIDLNLMDEANEYAKELKILSESENNDLIQIRSQIISALLLKENPRAKYRGKAEEILGELIERKIVDHELTITAMLNLFEILLIDSSCIF